MAMRVARVMPQACQIDGLYGRMEHSTLVRVVFPVHLPGRPVSIACSRRSVCYRQSLLAAAVRADADAAVLVAAVSMVCLIQRKRDIVAGQGVTAGCEEAGSGWPIDRGVRASSNRASDGGVQASLQWILSPELSQRRLQKVRSTRHRCRRLRQLRISRISAATATSPTAIDQRHPSTAPLPVTVKMRPAQILRGGGGKVP
jgi:hypothetical protein